MTTPSGNGWVNPIGAGLQPGRIDMGVDYTGTGSLYAMGGGTITSVKNAGWPGGTFIGLHLDTGQYMYYAENIIPHVSVGQKVRAGDLVGTAVGTYPFTEIGWAAPPGTGDTMAAQSGQAKLGQSEGDPGKYSTAYGVNMSNLIQSLGGPAGIQSSGSIQGSVPADFASTSGANAPSNATGCVPLIWVIYYAVRYTQEHGWHISSRKRRHWRRENEKRKQRRSKKTSKASLRHRRRMETWPEEEEP